MANSRPKPSNEEIRALEGRLEDCILRWGKRKNMECENQFRVAGNTVTCKFKTSASTFCNKTYKLQKSKEGSSWQISNFTNHINAEHNKTKKVSTASPTTNQNQEESTAISTPNSGNEVSRKRKSTTSGITLFCSLLIQQKLKLTQELFHVTTKSQTIFLIFEIFCFL